MAVGRMIGIFEEGWALADLWVFDLASKHWQEIVVSPRCTARPPGRGYGVSEIHEEPVGYSRCQLFDEQ